MDQYIYLSNSVWLYKDEDSWGDTDINRLKAVLNAVIEVFDSFKVASVGYKKVYVLPTRSDMRNPEIKHGKGQYLEIYLSARSCRWCQYIYQFAHEYSHYLIRNSYEIKYTTLWFEETICELSSIFCLRKIAKNWYVNPPYGFRDYVQYINPYAQDIINETNRIQTRANDWIKMNEYLLQDIRNREYPRELYSSLAVYLLPYFEQTQELWKMLPYLSEPDKGEYHGFNNFISVNLKRRIPFFMENVYMSFARIFS